MSKYQFACLIASSGRKGKDNSTKPILIQVLRMSFVAIVSVVVFESCAGIIANSLSLITESAHALLDAASTG